MKNFIQKIWNRLLIDSLCRSKIPLHCLLCLAIASLDFDSYAEQIDEGVTLLFHVWHSVILDWFRDMFPARFSILQDRQLHFVTFITEHKNLFEIVSWYI